jgi:hypothetical protein
MNWKEATHFKIGISKIKNPTAPNARTMAHSGCEFAGVLQLGDI